jgi:hypothetical protein
VRAQLGQGSNKFHVRGPAGTAASFTDPVLVSGGAGKDVFEGGAGNDLLSGFSGSTDADGDSLTGNDGDDQLSGSRGADLLNGGNGDDVLREVPFAGISDFPSTGDTRQDIYAGGPGVDTLNYANSPEVILNGSLNNGAAGRNTNGNGTAGLPLDVVGTIEVLNGTNLDDNLNAGADSRDGLVLDGRFGNDLIQGGNGKNTLKGSQGGDTLFGAGGDDTLVGGRGEDRLKGQDGNDVLDTKTDDFDSVLGQGLDFSSDCGNGTGDRAVLDLRDAAPTGCETVERSDRFERYHPKLGPRSRALSLAHDGTVGVSISCPRKQHRACAGRLELALVVEPAQPPAAAKASAGVRYKVRAGHKKAVRARLSASDASEVRGAGRALGADATGHEISRHHKPKTTIQRLTIRG